MSQTSFIMSDLIQTLYRTGQVARAKTLLKACHELDDGSVDFAFEGWLYYLIGEFEQSVDFAAAELEATPGS